MSLSAIEILARTSEGQKSGPLGFAVILVLCVACYFLFKSMSKHLKKVREEFPADEPPAVQAARAPAPAVTEKSVTEKSVTEESVTEESSPPTA